MARKSLLTESEIRRFMKLAQMNPVGKEKMQEMGMYPGARDEDDELESELHATEDELGAEDELADEEGDELDAVGGDEGLGDELEDMLATGVEALAAAWGIEDRVEVEGGEGADDLEVEDEVEMEMGPEGGELEMSAEEEVEEPMMEGEPALAQGARRAHPECKGLSGADYDECVKAQADQPGHRAQRRQRREPAGVTMGGVTGEGVSLDEDKPYTAKKEKPGEDLRKGAEERGAEGTKKKTSGKGRGEKKGDDAYVNEHDLTEDSGEEEGEHYRRNRDADDVHIAAIEHHLAALRHDRDYDDDHVDESARHDAIVNEVARRVAARMAQKSQKDEIAEKLAERILKRLTK